MAASSQDIDSGNTADKAIDGDGGTCWCSLVSDKTSWIMFDLGEICEVYDIRVNWKLHFKSTIEISKSGTSWINKKDAQGTVDIRYIRITFSDNGNKEQYLDSIYEIEVETINKPD